jgi:tetratricopeptide (TPR) repeat protein
VIGRHPVSGPCLFLLLVLGLALPAGANTGEVAPTPAADPNAHLLSLPQPDLSRLQPDVHAVLERVRRDLERAAADPATKSGDLARRYGSAGLFYQAHLLLEPAAACYLNAARLDPGDYRWPYYLGYAREQAADLSRAAQAYRQVLALAPGLQTAALRLGRVYLELGELERAEPLLRRAARVPTLAAMADFGLGRLAYARGDYAGAVEALERVLAVAPDASRVHYALGLAYRTLGRLDQARHHLAQRGEGLPTFPDALVERLDTLSTGQRMLFHSGMDAAHRDDYAAAVRLFREGLSLDPGNRHARVSLARFLYLSGERQAAREQLEQALAHGKGPNLGYFLLALLRDEARQTQAARSELEALLTREPAHSGAHFYLAGILWRAGEYAAAASHYGAARAAAPDNVEAALWQVLASILAGEAEMRLRELLERALAQEPTQPVLRFYLASLLATASDEAVRDGRRALELAQGLYDAQPSPAHAELLAMARAATGDFTGAQALQRRLVESALEQARLDLVVRLQSNLELYEGGQPCRTPWDLEALSSYPPPSNLPKVFRAYPSDRPF